RHPESSMEYEPPSRDLPPDQEAERNEDMGMLLGAIAHLPDRQRSVLEAHYLDELSYDKTAARLRIHRSSVRNDLRQSLKALRREMQVREMQDGIDLATSA